MREREVQEEDGEANRRSTHPVICLCVQLLYVIDLLFGLRTPFSRSSVRALFECNNWHTYRATSPTALLCLNLVLTL